MMLPARACALWALIGCSHALHRRDVHGDVGADIGAGGGIGNGDVGSGAGLVGEHGARGFRTLGRSCWDSEVWKSEFHLTRAMCAKTRLHRSMSNASQKVIRKLHEGKCITMVALGASTTYANCYGCWKAVLPNQYQTAWPGQMKKWLDMMFPCDEEGGHKVANFADPAADANYWKMMAHVWKADPSHILNQADLIFTETAVTDAACRMDPNPPMLTMPPQNWELMQADNELMLRVLKTLPKDPWIIMAEVNWRFDKERYTGDVHWDAILVHLPIAQHYDIDQVSVLDALLPLNQEKLQWLQEIYFVDYAHASPFGQQLIAQILAHTLMEESHYMNLPEHENAWHGPAWDEALPEPAWMDRELALMYDRVAPYDLIPRHSPYDHLLTRNDFEWNGHQLMATNLPSEWNGSYPTMVFWQNLSLNETKDTKPFKNKGYVNLGLRRLKQGGHCVLLYHVQENACGPSDEGANYTTGLDFEPYWPIPSSLRYNQGFWFDLPDATRVPMACMLMVLIWIGDPGSSPYDFLVDDLTVLA